MKPLIVQISEKIYYVVNLENNINNINHLITLYKKKII